MAKLCAWCGAPIPTGLRSDRRYKYCSDECAKAAHREKCRLRFKVRYAEKREQELSRYQLYYQQNKAKKDARTREWQQANRETYRAYQRELYRKRKAAKA